MGLALHRCMAIATIKTELTDVVRLVDGMADTIRQMKSFSGNQALSLQELSLNDVVRGALKLVGAQIRIEGTHVDLELCSPLPLVLGHSVKLGQVVLNLLTNAHQSLRRSDRAKKNITVSTFIVPAGGAASHPSVGLAVEDSGPGIASDIVHKIFSPFFTTKAPGTGTGLGLTMVSRIITEHSGTIDVDSPPGGPTRFVVTLPVVDPTTAEPH